MGYRSEVVLAISKDVMPQFLAILAKSPETRDMCFAYNDEVEKNYNDDGSLLIYWDAIKWYDSYEPVQLLENFMSKCEDGTFEDEVGDVDDGGALFRFVRIGEDEEDTETRGYGFDNICVHRAIEY